LIPAAAVPGSTPYLRSVPHSPGRYDDFRRWLFRPSGGTAVSNRRRFRRGCLPFLPAAHVADVLGVDYSRIVSELPLSPDGATGSTSKPGIGRMDIPSTCADSAICEGMGIPA